MKKYFILYLLTTLAFTCFAKEKTKMIRQGNAEVELFNNDWKFYRYGLQADGNRIEEPQNLSGTDLNDSNWRKLTLPHDFGIEGPFRMDLAGNTGRLPFQGIGWYRKSFKLSKEDASKQIYIDFDGVMAYAEVWLNDQYIGGWPYGYNSFRLDLTPFIKSDAENVLAIRTNTEKWDSRWYPGAGIYRNVWLVKTGKTHVAHWGTFITTTDITDQSAQINLEIEIENNQETAVKAKVVTDIFEINANDLFGKKVLSFENEDIQLVAHTSGKISQSKKITNYKKWDIESPNRYVAQTRIIVDGKTDDCYYTPFGIRTIEFSRNGFFLNGRKIEIKGVCNHHDLGALGAAFNKSALIRQIEIMQKMGCNSIRTSHNPPAPELLELADKMGILIMDEAFDAWAKGKREWDYNKLYDEWHEKDLKALVFRDRNHPSVFVWSIGNEVMEQRNVEMTKHLVDIVKSMDKTRPVTNGYNDPDGGRESGASTALDIMGVNYFFQQQAKWDADERYKNKPTVGTETSSCVSTRGVYYFDGEIRKDFQISSYDVDHPGWGCTPDKQFATNAEYPHLLGEYVWTGFDYLGEPTPFNSDNTNLLNFRTNPSKKAELEKKLEELKRLQPPSRSSYFGIVDLAGFPKDRYYIYQAHWRPELPMVHILPHWNWPDRTGKTVPVHVYTSGTEAELFVNNKSYGRKVKKEGKDFRLVWDNVVYEPGTVKVIAYKKGKVWAKDEIQTTTEATKITSISDKQIISNNGYEYAFITVRIEDKSGNLVPTANHKLKIDVTGCGELVATDNGDPTSFVPFQSNQREAFNGLALAIVKAKTGEKGNIKIKVDSPGLKPAQIQIRSK